MKTVTIEHEDSIDVNKFKDCIEDLGYEVVG